jgi:hypothetical protein
MRVRRELTDLDGLMRGLGALARAQPHVQSALVEAVNEYPAQSVGAFMPFFMRASITDGGQLSSLVLLEDRWAADGKKELKEAVLMARRPRKQ